ncbi:MAG: alpha/beta fold hydrolase [Synergistaceae bacterium]|nr:alpha/beta fold hydrolase [Synergistaceae bacterium]
MSDKFKSEVITLPGSFGSRQVKLSRLFPEREDGTHVLLLHGVHSSANLSPRNKFRHLACILAERGYVPWLCETSRRQANREDYSDDLAGWIMAAFNGKSFRNELDDCAAALRHVAAQIPGRLWLWGFSLGGIIALALACGGEYDIEKLILSGTGLVSMPEAERTMMKLPILSTLRETIDPAMLNSIRAEEATAFRGSNDEIFSEASCRSLLAAINLPPEKKKFFAIEGADHSLKMRRGRHDSKIMDEMLSLLTGR